jgi:hypothetical protein
VLSLFRSNGSPTASKFPSDSAVDPARQCTLRQYLAHDARIEDISLGITSNASSQQRLQALTADVDNLASTAEGHHANTDSGAMNGSNDVGGTAQKDENGDEKGKENGNASNKEGGLQ